MTHPTDLTHIRTVNGGTPELITAKAAIDEINAGMLDKAVRRTIRQMSAARGQADIEYRSGTKVSIRRATPEQVVQAAAVSASDAEIIDTLTPAMKRTLATMKNRAGFYRMNIGSGGIAGALKRRGLVEYRTDRSHRAWYFTETAIRIGFILAEPELASVLGPAPVERTPDGLRIVTVKGKRYVVSALRTSRTAPDHIEYWSERNGRPFGPTRNAAADNRPGTVAADIWAAVNR